ncbi:hypothetical protein Emed_000887 [Eimeria media]
METSHLFLFAGISLLSLNSGGAEVPPPPAVETTPVPITHTGRRVSCLQEMNAVRNDVGLPLFSEADPTDKLPILDPLTGEGREVEDAATDSTEGGGGTGGGVQGDTSDIKEQKTFLRSVCNALLEDIQANGTYMYAPQEREKEDCAAAVEYWKGAIEDFPTLPPGYLDSPDTYDDHRKISLVGLLNTRHNPTVDCALVTCHPGAKDEEEEEKPAEDEEGAEDEGEEDEDEVEEPEEEAGAEAGAEGAGKEQEGDHQQKEDEKVNGEEGRGDGDPASVSQVNASMAAHASDQVGEKTQVTSRLRRRLAAAETPVYGLVCLSRPQTLLGTQPPFT